MTVSSGLSCTAKQRWAPTTQPRSETPTGRTCWAIRRAASDTGDSQHGCRDDGLLAVKLHGEAEMGVADILLQRDAHGDVVLR